MNQRVVGQHAVAIVLLITMFAVGGCATAGKSTLNLVPRADYEFPNEELVDRPFEECWSSLVSELSRSFFVINNIEKESRIINLSFSVNNPEDYIDCGRSERTYTKGGKTQTFEYDVAADSDYRYDRDNGVGTAVAEYTVSRDTQLEGRINIFLAPEGDKTRVVATVRYLFKIVAGGNYIVKNGYGTTTDYGSITPSVTDISFNSGAVGKEDDIECVSNGRLEAMILDMARGRVNQATQDQMHSGSSQAND